MSIKHQLWTYLGSSSVGLRLIKLYAQLRNGDLGITEKNTDIVIEGYPRSANTSAVAAFRIANNNSLTIAHHVHGTAQIKQASRFKTPCLVLIRNPVDAVISLCIRDEKVSLQQAINNYLNFYLTIEPYQQSFVLAEFTEALHQFNDIILQLNTKFHTQFNTLDESMADSSAVKQTVQNMDKADNKSNRLNQSTVALPSDIKKEQKAHLKSIITKNSDLLSSIDEAHRQMQKLLKNR